jgi:hypothetical protein
MSRSASARSDAPCRNDRPAKRGRTPREHPTVVSDLNLGTDPLPCEIDLIHSLVGHLLDLEGENDADHVKDRKAKP